MKALLFDIKRFAVYDGPGIRTTLFFMGCPLSCAWCQNPEGQRDSVSLYYHAKKCIECGSCVHVCPVKKIRDQRSERFSSAPCRKGCTSCWEVCPSGAIEKVGDAYTLGSLMEVIMADKAYYAASGGGVTCSGGEPLVYAGFIEHLAKKLKKEGIGMCLETCGEASWESFQRVIPYIDHIYFDIKIISEASHAMFTGNVNRRILNNFSNLVQTSKSVTVRVPLIPGYTDTENNISEILQVLQQAEYPSDHPIELLPYNVLAETKYGKTGINVPSIPTYEVNVKKSQTYEQLQSIQKKFFQKGFKSVRILSFE